MFIQIYIYMSFFVFFFAQFNNGYEDQFDFFLPIILMTPQFLVESMKIPIIVPVLPTGTIGAACEELNDL